MWFDVDVAVMTRGIDASRYWRSQLRIMCRNRNIFIALTPERLGEGGYETLDLSNGIDQFIIKFGCDVDGDDCRHLLPLDSEYAPDVSEWAVDTNESSLLLTRESTSDLDDTTFLNYTRKHIRDQSRAFIDLWNRHGSVQFSFIPNETTERWNVNYPVLLIDDEERAEIINARKFAQSCLTSESRQERFGVLDESELD